MPAAGIVRRVHVAVLRVGGCAIRLGIGEIANHRVRALRGDVRRLFVVPDERRDLVSAAQQRIENRTADIAGGTGEEDSHRERYSLPQV